MNWDAVGAVAELLGSGGVIATLYYLIIQIRHNTRSIEASSLHATMSEGQSVTARIMDRNIAEVILKGLDDLSRLDDVDRLRFNAYVSSMGAYWADAYYQFRSGHFPTEMWQGFERDIISLQSNPCFRQVWLEQSAGWPTEFCEHIEHLVASPRPAELPRYFQTNA